jgi:hypothetical protein
MPRLKHVLATAAVLGALGAGSAACAQTVTYLDFSNTAGLTFAGDAAQVGNVLRLTPALTGQSGAAYSTSAVTLGVNNTFSTVFQFQFTNPGGIDPADGITFVLAANPSGLGAGGGGLGYEGVPNSVAIEFDTFWNGGLDLNSNHVAVDTGGVLTDQASASPYGVTDCTFGNGIGAGCFANGNIWTAIIGYNGSALSVRVADGNAPFQTVISNYAIDISSALGTNQAFVGFTAGTGSGFENQDILNWSFSNTTSLAAPEPATWAMMIVGFGLAGGMMRHRRRLTA